MAYFIIVKLEIYLIIVLVVHCEGEKGDRVHEGDGDDDYDDLDNVMMTMAVVVMMMARSTMVAGQT